MTLSKHDGFTLIETVVAMFMMTITMAAFYTVYRMQTRSLKGQEYRLEAQQTARAALDFMVRELRNARYNPTGEEDGDDCGDEADGKPGIVTATATTLHFSYDSSDPPDGDCDDVGENVRYSIAGNDITRTADGKEEELTDGNVATNGLTLAYFAEDNVTQLDSFPLNATDRARIKRVSITITINSKNPTDKFGGALTAEMKTNVDLRNPA